MAFTSLRASAEWESTASGTTLLTFSPSSDIEVGDTIVLGWCANIASLTFTCSDNSSQAGSANVYAIRTALSGTTFTAATTYILKATRKVLTTDVITVTISSACTRSTGQLAVFVSGNANPRLELPVNIAGDTASPVPMGATGTLYAANSLVVPFNFWKGGAVASGYALTVPAGATAIPGGGAVSGGASTSVETNGAYILNVGATTTMTPNATYTSITIAHGEMLTFSDEPIDGRVPVVRSVGAVGGGAFGAGLLPNLPTNPQPDDLMLLFVTLEESAALGTVPPTGWNSVGASVSVTGGGILYAFWRKWVLGDTSPNLTWTPTTDGGETQMVCVRVDTWDPVTPFEIYNTSSEATVDTSFSYAPGTSTTINNCLCWVTWTSGFDLGSGQGSGTATNASLTAIVGRLNGQTAGGLGAGFVAASGTKATAGTTGTWAQTALNATAKAYHSFAIRPQLLATGRPHIIQPRLVGAGR